MTEDGRQMTAIKVDVEHNGQFCDESCKWLVGGAMDPYCYLFGELYASEECSPLRHNACITGAKLIHEEFPA